MSWTEERSAAAGGNVGTKAATETHVGQTLNYSELEEGWM